MTTTHERILDATLDVVSVEGLGGMSLEQVATKAGVSRQTVYRHFGSRDELIQQTVLREERRIVDVLLRAVAGHDSFRSSLQAGLEACLIAARDHPLILPLLATEPAELLPHLVAGRAPVIDAALEILVDVVAGLTPELSDEDRLAITDAGIRLVVSHVITPSEAPLRDVAGFMADVFATWVEARTGALLP